MCAHAPIWKGVYGSQANFFTFYLEVSLLFTYFVCQTARLCQMNQKEGILMDKLRVTARKVVPPGGHVWLYGSRARGTAHDDSDWDLLILLDQPEITTADEDNIAYPLVVEGWNATANRLFYALFHAITALFVNDGVAVSSHQGAKIRFGKEYVLTGLATEAEGNNPNLFGFSLT